ncbi:MAG TPA: glycosyltransferase family 4 protein [Dongiaceae bacterium]|jgi:glycosyltransferase involved in cell wall biosynthesis|nr:glycosyltransferase family 4 protein [Dongiaceae bacterium]
MRVAFYAPLKPPDHPTPSGDRRVARLLMAALTHVGHEVWLASTLRLRARPAEQEALRDAALAETDRLIASFARGEQPRPDLWFTYHSYYKAPDWLGPAVSARLGIPYMLAEASHAPKRATGEWTLNHQASETAIRSAARIFCFNPRDKPQLAAAGAEEKLVDLPPFLDLGRYASSEIDRGTRRHRLARNHGLDETLPWLLAVGMMRAGDKSASYMMLAEALKGLGRPHEMLLVGDGAARAQIEAAFTGQRVHFLGAMEENALPHLYGACDLFVWPAINEAFGMALLEAHAMGLPAVAGDFGGVATIVADGFTGRVTPPGDATAFRAAIAELLGNPKRRRRMGEAARARALALHTLPHAAAILAQEITAVMREKS